MILALAAAPAVGLDVRTFTASELGFLASSHLLMGAEQAILVDTQFTRSEAFDVVRMVRSSRRLLTTIFITSPRPEHYLGLEVLVREFPEVRVVARGAVAEAIRQGAEEAIARWQPIYLDDLPTRVVVPEAFEDDVLWLDGTEIRLLDPGDENAVDRAPDDAGRVTGDAMAEGGETPPAEGYPTLLYVPSEKTLLASDLAVVQVHPWLGDVDPVEWSRRLDALRRTAAIEWVFPGHGAGGGRRLLEESAEYLAALRAALAGHRSAAEVAGAMKAAYPGLRLPVLLERSVKTLLQGSRR